MPTLQLADDEPLLSTILAATDLVDVETAVVLRQVLTSGPGEVDDPDGDEEGSGLGEVTMVVVELDAGTADEPPPGWTWLDLDEGAVSRLEPRTSQAAVASWARERAEGWSPSRPPWSYPGWFSAASAWVVEQMASDGHPALGPPRQHQLWGLSVVLRASAADGDVYFKCSADIFKHEAVVTRALALEMPDLAPEVIAVDGTHGWMLMRDLGAPELGDQDESLWHEGVVAHAAIQQLWTTRTDELIELSLPVRSLADLATQVEQLTDDPGLLGQMSAGLRERWLATVPALVESCRRLDQIGPAPTLVHGDFHPWNVVHGPSGTRVFDWTDAAVSHPSVDLATYVFRTRDLAVRRSLVDAWVAAWSDHGSERLLGEAAALGLVVGALYQVQTYRALLPTLMANGADDGMSGSDVSWINRSLTRHERGLASPI